MPKVFKKKGMPAGKNFPTFKPGSLVFAKVKGYSHWPARVEALKIPRINARETSYEIFFYWTYQRAVCKGGQMYDYHKFRERFTNRKVYGLEEAIQELESNPLVQSNVQNQQKKIAKHHDGKVSGKIVKSTSPAKKDINEHPLVVEGNGLKIPLVQECTSTERPLALEATSNESSLTVEGTSSETLQVVEVKLSSHKKKFDCSLQNTVEKQKASKKASVGPPEKQFKAPSPAKCPVESPKKITAPTVMHIDNLPSKLCPDLSTLDNPALLRLLKPCCVRLEPLNLSFLTSKVCIDKTSIECNLVPNSDSIDECKTNNEAPKMLLNVPKVITAVENFAKSPKIPLKVALSGKPISPIQALALSHVDVTASSSSTSNSTMPSQNLISALPTNTSSVSKSNESRIKRYNCIICDKVFKQFVNLQLHVKKIHGKLPCCLKCKQYFVSNGQFNSHLAGCKVLCKFCKMFVLSNDLKSHECCKLRCENCNLYFQNIKELGKHSSCCKVKCTLDETSYDSICNFCNRTCEDIYQLNFHVLINHSQSSNIVLNQKQSTQLETLMLIKQFLNKFLEERKNDQDNFIIFCSECEIDFKPEEYFDTHIEQFPYTLICRCPFCGLDPSDCEQGVLVYLEHFKRHFFSSLSVIKCTYCEVLATDFNQILHMKHKHKDKTSKNNQNSLKCLTVNFDHDSIMKKVQEVFNLGPPQVLPKLNSLGVHKKESRNIKNIEKCSPLTSELVKQPSSSDFKLLQKNVSKNNVTETSTFNAQLNFNQQNDNKQQLTLPKIVQNTSDTLTHKLETPANVAETEKISKNISAEVADVSNTNEVDGTETNYVPDYDATSDLNIDNPDVVSNNSDTAEEVDVTVHCICCSKDVVDTDYFRNHFIDCLQGKEFDCPLCGIYIDNKDLTPLTFLTHLYAEHFSISMKSVQCEKCGQLFYNSFNYAVHAEIFHKEIDVEAPSTSKICITSIPKLRSGKIFKFNRAHNDLIASSVSKLNEAKEKHNNSIFCNCCTIDVPYETYFMSHIKDCSFGKYYLCSFCKESFNMENEKDPIKYISHVETHFLHNPLSYFKCECGLSFIDGYNGLLHITKNKHLFVKGTIFSMSR